MYAPLRRFIIENSFRACVAWHIYGASQSPKGFIGVLKPPPHLAASTDPSAPPPAADPARSTGTHSPDRTTSDPMGTHLHKVRLISPPMVSYCALVVAASLIRSECVLLARLDGFACGGCRFRHVRSRAM
jgi:hypothetical protein